MSDIDRRFARIRGSTEGVRAPHELKAKLLAEVRRAALLPVRPRFGWLAKAGLAGLGVAILVVTTSLVLRSSPSGSASAPVGRVGASEAPAQPSQADAEPLEPADVGVQPSSEASPDDAASVITPVEPQVPLAQELGAPVQAPPPSQSAALLLQTRCGLRNVSSATYKQTRKWSERDLSQVPAEARELLNAEISAGMRSLGSERGGWIAVGQVRYDFIERTGGRERGPPDLSTGLATFRILPGGWFAAVVREGSSHLLMPPAAQPHLLHFEPASRERAVFAIGSVRLSPGGTPARLQVRSRLEPPVTGPAPMLTLRLADCPGLSTADANELRYPLVNERAEFKQLRPGRFRVGIEGGSYARVTEDVELDSVSVVTLQVERAEVLEVSFVAGREDALRETPGVEAELRGGTRWRITPDASLEVTQSLHELRLEGGAAWKGVRLGLGDVTTYRYRKLTAPTAPLREVLARGSVYLLHHVETDLWLLLQVSPARR